MSDSNRTPRRGASIAGKTTSPNDWVHGRKAESVTWKLHVSSYQYALDTDSRCQRSLTNIFSPSSAVTRILMVIVKAGCLIGCSSGRLAITAI